MSSWADKPVDLGQSASYEKGPQTPITVGTRLLASWIAACHRGTGTVNNPSPSRQLTVRRPPIATKRKPNHKSELFRPAEVLDLLDWQAYEVREGYVRGLNEAMMYLERFIAQYEAIHIKRMRAIHLHTCL